MHLRFCRFYWGIFGSRDKNQIVWYGLQLATLSIFNSMTGKHRVTRGLGQVWVCRFVNDSFWESIILSYSHVRKLFCLGRPQEANDCKTLQDPGIHTCTCTPCFFYSQVSSHQKQGSFLEVLVSPVQVWFQGV